MKLAFRYFAFVKESLHAGGYNVNAMRNSELANRIRAKMDRLTPRERALATYVLSNFEQVPLLNSAELAREAGSSSATVTRFSQNLGYSGFLDLRDSLRSELRSAYRPSGPEHTSSFVTDFWQAEAENTLEAAQIPADSIRQLANDLAGARAVWLGGIQTMRSIALTMEYFLDLFRANTHVLVEDVRVRPERLLDMTPDDVAVLFTVRRYAKATTRLGQALVSRGVKLYLITDDGAPPLARIADHTIRVPTKSAANMPSITAFLQLAQLVGLLVGAKCGNERSELADELFREYEAFEY